MKKVILALWVLCVSVGADDIVVSLATETQLKPVYLAPWMEAADGELEAGYLQELGHVLSFDLNAGGICICATTNPQRDELAHSEGVHTYDADAWRDLGVLYVVRGVVRGKRLHIRVDGPQKATFAAQLSGNLATDRRQMHRLADALHQDLFGQVGIADTKLLYTVRHYVTDGWRSEVWLADYDGANAHPITRDGSYCVTPSFSSDGTFTYVSYRSGQPKIYVGSFAAGGSHRLTDLRGNQLMPVSSPANGQVAFISDAGGNPDVFLHQPGSKPRQIFAAQGAAQASPTFSPDGGQLAFVSNKDGAPRIYIMEVPGQDELARSKRPKLITRASRESTCPAWSPDGQHIAYSAMTLGTRQIWVYDTVAHQERQLTFSAGHKENPSWAADSAHLVYNSETHSGCELYLVSLTNPKPVQITSGPGEKRFPSWGS